jgi:hypothetical protein
MMVTTTNSTTRTTKIKTNNMKKDNLEINFFLKQFSILSIMVYGTVYHDHILNNYIKKSHKIQKRNPLGLLLNV